MNNKELIQKINLKIIQARLLVKSFDKENRNADVLLAKIEAYEDILVFIVE